MIRGLYTAGSGMLLEGLRADVVANNLANVSTVGYKRERTATAAFPELLLQRVNDGQTAPVIGRFGSGAALDEASPDLQAGPLRHTGRALDVAWVTDGFFAVEGALGEVWYTRDGRFQVDAEGWLLHSSGRRILGVDGPVRLTQGEPLGSVLVSDDGQIWVDGQSVAQLAGFDFAARAALERRGENLWRAEDQVPVVVRVRSEYVEQSNVNVVAEMVKMIQVQRAYEANQRVIQAHDEILSKAVNEVGTV